MLRRPHSTPPPSHSPPSKENLRNLRNLRTSLLRWRWLIRGQIQGVGFRPFLFRLATSSHLTGTVRNTPAGVHLEIQGPPHALQSFAQNFQSQLPPLARVDSCQKTKIKTLPHERSFLIDTTQNTTEANPLSAFSLQPSAFSSPSSSHSSFIIHHSSFAPVTPDTAVCPDCLREMLDPDDRRYQHALINCTNCGPRFSILKNVPYDRQNTTMAPFKMCPACAKEYKNPADRRFHAQPVCCPNCGPQISLVLIPHNSGRKPGAKTRKRPRPVRADPITTAARLLLAGKIVAIKGLGGFHLAVRADRPAAVARLRKLKKRDAKPFAIMVPDLAAALALANISPPAQAELTSPRAPIILSPRRTTPDPTSTPPSHSPRTSSLSSPHLSTASSPPASPHSALSLSPSVNTPATTPAPPAPFPSASPVAPTVAPGTDLLGLMLPYTPLHHLLFRSLASLSASPKPSRSLHPVPPLVMTSGNVSSEPLVIDNDDALARLGPMCDAILWHNRPIERCVDDSVILDRGPDRPPLPIRRSRGYVPVPWPCDPPPQTLVKSSLAPASGICLGGELKNTIAVLRGNEIILSQHLGDLSDARSFAHFQKAVEDLIRLFHVKIDFVAHDLHPNYMSTHAAKDLAARYQARLIPLQHHLAHAYGVMGEHHLTQALAIICDGTGYGTDNTIWGGELLAINGTHWQRLGCLRPMRLPGGDAAALDPRRSALSLLHSTFGPGFENLPEAKALFPNKHERIMLARMISSGLSSPWTSSTGRHFDAIAALLGVCLRNDHEAQAAMALEAVAGSAGADLPVGEYYAIRRGAAEGDEPKGLWQLDLTPFIRYVVAQCRGARKRRPDVVQVAHLARLFHRELARGFVALARRASEGYGMLGKNLVASGGSLCNRILESELRDSGTKAGFSAFFHELYPPTDAGLAFGQAIYCRRMGLTDEL